MYSVVGLMYDQLYAHFDVTPSDVGLGYGTVLSSAIGIAVTTIALILAVGGLISLLSRRNILSSVLSRQGPFLSIVIAALLVIPLVTGFLLGYADGVPSRIGTLCSISPLRVGPVVVVRLRVYSATIQFESTRAR
jgi:nitrate reductase gamma subunit